MQSRLAGKIAKIRMRRIVDPSVPASGYVDASRAGQVITNLLSNAVKFCVDGGGARGLYALAA